MSDSLVIPKDFPKILGTLVGMNLQIFFISFQVSQLRRKVFTQKFMKDNFEKIHKQQLKEEIQHMGYPDTGENIYSEKLPYKDWFTFNVLQEIHQEALANISFATWSTVAAGLIKPNYGVGIGISYMIGRAIYGFFYRKDGVKSKGKKVGQAICWISILAGLGIFAKQFLIKK